MTQGGTGTASRRGEPFNCAAWSGNAGSLAFPVYGFDQSIPLPAPKTKRTSCAAGLKTDPRVPSARTCRPLGAGPESQSDIAATRFHGTFALRA
jgi:hypothetical protein